MPPEPATRAGVAMRWFTRPSAATRASTMLTTTAEQPEEVLSSGEPPAAPVLEEKTQEGSARDVPTAPAANESTDAWTTSTEKPAKKKVTAKRKAVKKAVTKRAVTKKAGKKAPGSPRH